MAKIDPTEITPAMRKMLRGRVLIRVTPWGTVASKWPKKMPAKRTPYRLYKEVEFGRAAQFSTSAIGEQVISAQLQTKGSGNVPRDLLTAAAYGTAMQITLADGTRLIPAHMTQPNPQYVLDLVGDTEGAILWRSPDGWVLLAPSNNGDLLTMRDAAPAWEAAPFIPPGNAWYLAASWTHSSNVANVDFSVAPATEYYVMARNLTLSLSGTRAVRISTDGGATYPSSSGDYVQLAADGSMTNTTSFATHSTNATAARSVMGHIIAAQLAGVYHVCTSPQSGGRLYALSQDPITNIRVLCSSGVITGGAIEILAR